jgi:hypothetical protein
MLKSLSFGASLFILLAACATAPSAPPTAAAAQTAKPAPPAGCVSATGTTLPTRPTSCTGPGSTYSSADLQQTGATTIPDALRRLDPDVTITH